MTCQAALVANVVINRIGFRNLRAFIKPMLTFQGDVEVCQRTGHISDAVAAGTCRTYILALAVVLAIVPFLQCAVVPIVESVAPAIIANH